MYGHPFDYSTTVSLEDKFCERKTLTNKQAWEIYGDGTSKHGTFGFERG